MSKLRRDVIKYVRDKAKSNYKKDTECRICGETENLDFHHYYSLSPLMYKWAKENGLDLENVVEWRDRFIEEHQAELYEHTVTLCKFHHRERLHAIYGKDPSLFTAPKQMKWVEIQREKHYGST